MFDVVIAFAVSYSIPYIIADLGAKIGFVFMGVCITGILYSILLLPELTGRSLEEVDEMFEHRPKLWAWQFKHFETHGAGRRLTELELNKAGDKFEAGQAVAEETGRRSEDKPKTTEVEIV